MWPKRPASVVIESATYLLTISSPVTKEGALWVARPLATLFTLSLSQGCLPSDWTSANITPVLKKGNKQLVTIYGLISLTNTVVKLLVRLVHCQLTDSWRETTNFHLFNMVSKTVTHVKHNYWRWCTNGLAVLTEPEVHT